MYISIDIGKSNTRVASSLDLETIHKISKFPSNTDLEEQRKLLTNAINEVLNNETVEGLALGVPGLIDRHNKKFLRCANYPVLNGLDFNVLVPDHLKDIVLYVENDASLSALGEAYCGLGKTKNRVAYLTLSSGVGGSLILKQPKGYDFIIAEPGHHIISESDTIVDKSGLSGTLESFCSGHMFEERYGAKPEKNTDKEVWKQYAKHLSTGIINITALWNPEIIILGGGVSIYNFEIFYPYLTEELTKQSFFDIPEIKKTILGDDTGVYGGFVLLKESL